MEDLINLWHAYGSGVIAIVIGIILAIGIAKKMLKFVVFITIVGILLFAYKNGLLDTVISYIK